jgi:hypothetical protein
MSIEKTQDLLSANSEYVNAPITFQKRARVKNETKTEKESGSVTSIIVDHMFLTFSAIGLDSWQRIAVCQR